MANRPIFMQAVPLAGFFGLTGVVLGALGAHGLEGFLVDQGMTKAWETAVLYQLVHAVAILAWGTHRQNQWVPSLCWGLGIIFFSGSLYILALGGPRFLGPVTPIGGLFFLAGWLSVILSRKTTS